MTGTVKKFHIMLVLCGTGQLFCYLFLLFLGDLRENILACEVVFFTAFFLYGASLFLLITRQTQPHETETDEQSSDACSKKRMVFAVILIFAVCFRIVLWLSPPTLSDDIYRYIWEGRLVSMGINPFEYAPDASQLENMRDQKIFPRINHKDFVTIYPPLNQFMFSVSTQLHPSIKMMKLTFVIFDLLTMVVLILTLFTLKTDLNRIIIYAWNPLIIMEFAGSGHLDSAAIFFLMLSFYLFIKSKTFSSILSLALSFLGPFVSALISWKISRTYLPSLYTEEKKVSGNGTLCACYVQCLPAVSQCG